MKFVKLISDGVELVQHSGSSEQAPFGDGDQQIWTTCVRTVLQTHKALTGERSNAQHLASTHRRFQKHDSSQSDRQSVYSPAIYIKIYTCTSGKNSNRLMWHTG